MSVTDVPSQFFQYERSRAGRKLKKLRVLLLAFFGALLCLVLADFLYCAHIDRQRSVRQSIGYGTTPADVLRLLGEPDTRDGGKWIYRFHEPETMAADSMIVWLLLSGRFGFWDCTFTVEFDDSDNIKDVSYHRLQN
jgi:hypothetical protein